MKILFISQGNLPEYQCDSLFHGLRLLFGDDIVDVNKISYMYKSFPEEAKKKLYGRGFTLYGLLEDISIDRTNIESKIIKKYFDLIIYGSIQRCQDYLPLVLNIYSPDKIFFINGEDQPTNLNYLLTRGKYFKRELYQENRYLFPIHFAIPEEKIIKNIDNLEKINFFAPCNPTDKTTYVYDTEKAYYQQYQESFFGITMKKAGWDCLRHYEISDQGCAPYFLDIRELPYLTMHRFPRYEVLKLMQIADHYLETESLDLDNYLTSFESLLNYTKKYLTTKSLAQYLVEFI
ncbi:hypothetical protein AA637_14840 [Cyanobacterium sp. HL-69]|uniref:hypothetical protein n=1 Tax=Cyanobacterium sp. HL-69 TaxID=2054282 RepID=UPI000CA09A78|nr:hypothetical protein AA637_14840 [Cyanobacterium sp. HL-69]